MAEVGQTTTFKNVVWSDCIGILDADGRIDSGLVVQVARELRTICNIPAEFETDTIGDLVRMTYASRLITNAFGSNWETNPKARTYLLSVLL